MFLPISQNVENRKLGLWERFDKIFGTDAQICLRIFNFIFQI